VGEHGQGRRQRQAGEEGEKARGSVAELGGPEGGGQEGVVKRCVRADHPGRRGHSMIEGLPAGEAIGVVEDLRVRVIPGVSSGKDEGGPKDAGEER
jgi:hypothetical protein